MSEIAPESLTVLRLPSALAAGAVVWLTGAMARELGGSDRAALIASACAAVSAIVLFTGHLLSTATFDLLCWTAVSWLVVRALRRGDDRLWLVAGVVLGLGLLNKALPAFLALGLLAGVVIAGPRELLRNRFVWAGAAIALALWSPWLIWQADRGWPQIDVSREIASGGSTSSEPWFLMVPFQVLLASPPIAPVWIAGLVRLFREPELRFLGWAWAVLAVVFMASGGKPYYLAGLLPLLLAAGARPVDEWVSRGTRRGAALVAAVAVSAAVGLVIALPVLPADKADPVLAVNEDVGETVGWPELANTVDRVRGRSAVILTLNYGQAGAIERFGRGSPPVFSGHNAYADWGPPPGSAGPVIAVGRGLTPHLRGCRQVASIDNADGVDNNERGAPVFACTGPRRPWALEWPSLRRLG